MVCARGHVWRHTVLVLADLHYSRAYDQEQDALLLVLGVGRVDDLSVHRY